MGKVSVEESLLVGAPPDVVYRVISDPAHHARILPDAFENYRPEGNSTITFSLRIGRIKRDFTILTEQTEPDKLFKEIDLETNIVTEFRLKPHEQGTIVTIATHYETEKSISGFMESLFGPVFLRRLYQEELVKLGRYVLLVGNAS